MRSRWSYVSVFVCLGAALLLAAGCLREETGETIMETDEPEFRRGRDRIKQGRTPEALIEFDKVLAKRGLNNAPETHFEMALIYQDHVRDYLTAIYHYKKYMELMPNSPQRDKVQQRIAAAQREYMSTLPGRPSMDMGGASPDYVETINRLRAQNERLRAELAAAQTAAARVPLNTAPRQTTGRIVAAENPIVAAAPNTPVAQNVPVATQQPARVVTQQPQNTTTVATATVSQPAQPQQAAPTRRHVVRQGDSLYNIARQHYGSASNAQVEAIVNANRNVLQSRNTPLRVGMELRIP